MPMIRDLYNVPGMGGWAVDDDGNAVAYRMSGCPAMGDAPLASVNVHWYLPSNADLITTQAKRNLSSRSGIGGVLSAT
jgi:hypothetical protein